MLAYNANSCPPWLARWWKKFKDDPDFCPLTSLEWEVEPPYLIGNIVGLGGGYLCPEGDGIDFNAWANKLPGDVPSSLMDKLRQAFDLDTPDGAQKAQDFVSDTNASGNEGLLEHFIDHSEHVDAWEKAIEGRLVHMRVNTDYLETLAEYTEGILTRRFPNRLDIHEEAIIRHFTTPDGYYNLNAALRGEIPMTDELAEYASTLNSSLAKLPSHIGRTYRGVGPEEGNFLKNLSTGDAFTVNDFYSTSFGEDIGHVFRSRHGGDVLVIVNGTKGKNISTISAADFEGELLFQTQSRFRKTGEFPGIDPGTGEQITEIVIEQID